jgi:hypothetical protein
MALRAATKLTRQKHSSEAEALDLIPAPKIKKVSQMLKGQVTR